MDDDVNKIIFLVLLLLILGFAGCAIKFSASMEAKQFNKFSKTQITWFDALWANYRILPDK